MSVVTRVEGGVAPDTEAARKLLYVSYSQPCVTRYKLGKLLRSSPISLSVTHSTGPKLGWPLQLAVT